MAKFLHIGFNFVGGGDKVEDIKKKLDTAFDWYRYAPNCWIVWTNRTPEEWYAILKPLLKESVDSVLIVEINASNRYGALEQVGWDWLKKVR